MGLHGEQRISLVRCTLAGSTSAEMQKCGLDCLAECGCHVRISRTSDCHCCSCSGLYSWGSIRSASDSAGRAIPDSQVHACSADQHLYVAVRLNCPTHAPVAADDRLLVLQPRCLVRPSGIETLTRSIYD